MFWKSTPLQPTVSSPSHCRFQIPFHTEEKEEKLGSRDTSYICDSEKNQQSSLQHWTRVKSAQEFPWKLSKIVRDFWSVGEKKTGSWNQMIKLHLNEENFVENLSDLVLSKTKRFCFVFLSKDETLKIDIMILDD